MAQDTLRIGRQRLRNQHLIGTPLASPEQVVGWLGAVQAQDFAAAKWGVAQRARGCSDADVEAAFASGRILRTHVLRPTWHFVLPEDIRWLQALTAPRVRAAMRYYDRKLELDRSVLKRSHAVLARTLAGGRHATRGELGQQLARAKIQASGQRLGHLMMHAELDALICSGPRRGKQHTYALLDERAPSSARAPDRDEALARLALRYFTGHGPALVQDFAWWSGLTVNDARAGLAAVQARLAHALLDGKTYWFAADQPKRVPAGEVVHLLPNYDELLIAYRDHAASFDPATRAAAGPLERYVFSHIVVRNGHVIGGWQRTLERGEARVQLRLFAQLDAAGKRALQRALERYARFLGSPVRLSP